LGGMSFDNLQRVSTISDGIFVVFDAFTEDIEGVHAIPRTIGHKSRIPK
jgi:hypothetical protein